MNDCPDGEMRDLLPDLLHRRLPEAQRRRVDAHVAGCADCRAELELLTQLRSTLRRPPAVDVAQIVRALPACQPTVRVRWGGWRAAAAVVAIAVGATSITVARHAFTPASAPPSAVVVASGSPSVSPTTDTTMQSSPRTSGARYPIAGSGMPPRVAEEPVRHELAVSGAVSDLDDRELAALLGSIESLDAVPAATSDAESGSLAPAARAPRRGTS